MGANFTTAQKLMDRQRRRAVKSSCSTPRRNGGFILKPRNKLQSSSSVYFTASCCGPCHQIQPFVTEFAEKYINDVDFIQIDVDELHDMAEEFGVQVMPSFMLLKRGKVVDKVIVGAKKEDLQKKIKKHRF